MQQQTNITKTYNQLTIRMQQRWIFIILHICSTYVKCKEVFDVQIFPAVHHSDDEELSITLMMKNVSRKIGEAQKWTD